MLTSMLLAQLLRHWQLKLIIITQKGKGSILMNELTRSIYAGFPTKLMLQLGLEMPSLRQQ